MLRERRDGATGVGGINIYCGSFIGRDKSGTPFEAVLAEIAEQSGGDAKKVVEAVEAALEVASDHVLIEPDAASKIVQPLRRWIEIDRIKGQLQLKKCAEDLISACDVAIETGEPIAIVW